MNRKFAQKIASLLYPFQLKIEIASIFLVAIGILLMDSEAGKMIIIISLNALSILYFLMAFRVDAKKSIYHSFFHKLIYISYSVGILGILFTINNYHGAEMMMMIAFISIIIGLVAIAILKLRNQENEKFLDADLMRVVILSITILLFFSFGEMITKKENTYKEKTEIPTENNN